MPDSQFDEIAQQILQIYKPIEMLHAGIDNSLLLFKMALGLTQDVTLINCFEVLKNSVDSSHLPLELINTADGPHKLHVPTSTWSLLPEHIQTAIKQFNSMLSSCHRYIGSCELKLVDIQLKLEDLHLLPLPEHKAQELQKLEEILPRIKQFTNKVETLFYDINEGGKLLEHQISGTSNGF